MRVISTLAVCAALTSTSARASDVPLSLTGPDVPLSPIGLPFNPDAPRPLTPDHPLYHRIALEPVADLPSVVGAAATLGWSGAAKRSSIEKALRETLERLNMLVPAVTEAKAVLKPRWVALDQPFRIGFIGKATVRMTWTLTRVDNGQTLFEREIATFAETRGGDGAYRANGVARVAIMTNIASAALCIDKAAYGQAPADCALTPGFTYQAPRRDILFIPVFVH